MAERKKRRAHGEGTIRWKEEKSLWEARFVTGIDPETGKPLRKSVYGKTQKEARQKMTAAVAALDKGEYREPSKMTVGQWLDFWQENYLSDVKPSTKLLYEQQIRLYIKPILGDIRLENLDTDTIQRFYKKIGEESSRKQGLSAKSIRNVHGILHKALQQAVVSNKLRSNPTSGCKPPRAISKEIQPLYEDQIPLFLDAIEGHCHEYIFKFALFTGMREGEVLGLMWDCVDFRRGTIHIKRQLCREKCKGGHYYFGPPKNGKSRIIAPAPDIMELLRLQKEKQEKQKLRAGELWGDTGVDYTGVNGTSLVFTNELGEHVSYRTVYDCFRRVMDKLEIPGHCVHDLRHTYAVLSLLAGDDPKTLQENLGHATAAFTLDRYAHVTEQMRRNSANRMQQYINNMTKGKRII